MNELIETAVALDAVAEETTAKALSNLEYYYSITDLSEKLVIGAEVFVLGMIMVFAVLAILWGVIEIFRVIFYEIPKKKAAPDTETASGADVTAPTIVETHSAGDDAYNSNEPELIAAITAAVTAYIDAENAASGSKTRFRVVSFRRTGR